MSFKHMALKYATGRTPLTQPSSFQGFLNPKAPEFLGSFTSDNDRRIMRRWGGFFPRTFPPRDPPGPTAPRCPLLVALSDRAQPLRRRHNAFAFLPAALNRIPYAAAARAIAPVPGTLLPPSARLSGGRCRDHPNLRILVWCPGPLAHSSSLMPNPEP